MHPLTELVMGYKPPEGIDSSTRQACYDKLITDYLKSRIEWVKNRKSSSVSFIDMLELSVGEKCEQCENPMQKGMHTCKPIEPKPKLPILETLNHRDDSLETRFKKLEENLHKILDYLRGGE